LAAILSPFLAVEEAYLLARYVRGIDPEAFLALGPVPIVGEDERFPNGFTISAEKCPNRRGVEEVIAHFMQRVPTLDDLLPLLDAGRFGGVWVSGGYRQPWIDEAAAQRIVRAPVSIVQDLFPSPLSERASYVLPAGAYPEREGSYVNRREHLQTSRRAIRPPAGVRPEGSLLWELSARKGLYSAAEVLHEMAVEILYFRAATGRIPPTGLHLKVNLLAEATTPPQPNLA
jgi:NADH-quinone oxidoreductase subunit G